MSKYIFWILAVALAWWWWRRSQRKAERPTAPTVQGDDGAMSQCAACGVYFPRADGFVVGDKSYCCEAHRPHP